MSKLGTGAAMPLLALFACHEGALPAESVSPSNETDRMEEGGELEPDTSQDSTGTSTFEDSQPKQTRASCDDKIPQVGPLSDETPRSAKKVFRLEARAWGVPVLAASGVDRKLVRHAAHVLAEYIDNDEDCRPDDPKVLDELVRNQATLVLFKTESDVERNWNKLVRALPGVFPQDLFATEIHPEGPRAGAFDATLEETLHLVTNAGWSPAYPTVFGIDEESRLTQAMDVARGGHFEKAPKRYPKGAWFHYDDPTCDHVCSASEYFYWLVTTQLGAQAHPRRCEEIRNEWPLCTRAQLKSRDRAGVRLLNDPKYRLPERLPDGDYSPRR